MRVADVLLKNVRPLGGSMSDVLVRDGIIAAIGPQVDHASAPQVVDGRGDILMPGFVEGHVHLDKILWGLPYQPVRAGPDLLDYVQNEKRIRLEELEVSTETRAGNLIRQCISKGTCAIRTHVDIDPDYGLSNLESVLRAVETYKNEIDIQIVAFPQSGVLRRPGTAELLDAAITNGADLVGGLDPAVIDRDPAGQLDVIFKIAEKHGVGIDIHQHEPGILGAFTIDLFLDRVEAHGLQGNAVIGHAWCLGEIPDDVFGPLVERIARNDVAILTSAPGAKTIPPIKKLRDSGVTVFAASDSLRDTWNPYGNGDMLERTMLVGWRSNFRRDEEIMMALDTTTYAGARALHLKGYGIEVGDFADFFTVPAESVPHAIVSRPERRLVFKRGCVVARDGVFSGARMTSS
jgi:cytosine/adenosine deaminase-related metal-dependent hydrolase